jgi:hypothetical protein
MQQPRQMYGLGSFVKKVTRKITKPVTKVAKKLVPKEIAGIMRVAAPFLPPGYREAAYLLGTAKQTGRISPVDLAIAATPTFLENTETGQNLTAAFKGSKTGQFLLGTPDPVLGTGGTTGLIGEGGQMFQLGKGFLPGTGAKQSFGVLDTKAGQFLLGGEKPGTFSKSKLAGLGVGTLSLVTAAKTPEEAGEALAAQTGNSDDYERGVQLFSQLNSGVFDIPTLYRQTAQAGGLMRENYALGTMPTAQESGLGGLPIEADMRYTGGFMPYGAKEKADDVPARLSKNEFVFTADAVRAAGGGSVQKGAQRMYNTMKQLEAKPEAKRMTA